MARAGTPKHLIERIVAAIRRGEELDLGWTVVPAALLRSALLRAVADRPDPRGLRLRRTIVVGRLDLDEMTVPMPLTLSRCRLPDGISARGASLRVLALENSYLSARGPVPA